MNVLLANTLIEGHEFADENPKLNIEYVVIPSTYSRLWAVKPENIYALPLGPYIGSDTEKLLELAHERAELVGANYWELKS